MSSTGSCPGQRVSKILIAALTAFIGAALYVVVTNWMDYSLTKKAYGGEAVHFNDVQEVIVRSENQVLMIGLSALAVAFFMLAFVSKTVGVPNVLGVEDQKYSPGLALGGFFIPFVSWVLPYLAMQEAWKASDPDAPKDHWKGGRGSVAITVWWLSWCATIVAFMVFDTFNADLENAELAILMKATTEKLIVSVLLVLLGVSALIMVRNVSQRSLAKWETMSSESIASARAQKEGAAS